MRTVFLVLCIAFLANMRVSAALPGSSPRATPKPRSSPSGSDKNNLTNVKSQTPTPTPTPSASYNLEARQALKREVDTAWKAIIDSQSPGRTVKEIIQLRDEINAFNNKVDSPNSKIEDLKLEGDKIIADANSISDGTQPTFFSTVIGTSLSGYLARIAAVILFVLILAILGMLLHFHREVGNLNRSSRKQGQGIEVLEKMVSRLEDGVNKRLAESGQVNNGQVSEPLTTEFLSLKSEITSLFSEIRERLPSRKEEKTKLGEQELPPRLELLSRDVFVNDLLQSIEQDRQISVSYEIANGNFVADPTGKLVVITDDSNHDDAILLPKASRLISPDQFDTYYTQTYDCEYLSLGSLFILIPAVVQKQNGSWKLATRGKLELRN